MFSESEDVPELHGFFDVAVEFDLSLKQRGLDSSFAEEDRRPEPCGHLDREEGIRWDLADLESGDAIFDAKSEPLLDAVVGGQVQPDHRAHVASSVGVEPVHELLG